MVYEHAAAEIGGKVEGIEGIAVRGIVRGDGVVLKAKKFQGGCLTTVMGD